MESMKNAVEVGLGVAFVSRSAVEKEVALGSLAVLTVRGVLLQRTLLCVTDPVRYCSKAVRAFTQEMFGVTIETTAAGCFLPDQVRSKASHGAARFSPPEEFQAPCIQVGMLGLER